MPNSNGDLFSAFLIAILSRFLATCQPNFMPNPKDRFPIKPRGRYMKKLLVLLTLWLPVHAWGDCYFYDASVSGQKPAGIPSTATKLSNPFSQGTYGDGGCTSLIERYYYDSDLNVYMIIYVCSGCNSGYTAIRNYISVGSCSFPNTDAISYSCWDTTQGLVRTSLPSGATVLATYGGDNCAKSSTPVYVKSAGSTNSYYKVEQCISYSDSKIRWARYYSIINQVNTYTTYPVFDFATCAIGKGLKSGSGSDQCQTCSAGTFNNGIYTFCQKASAGYYVSDTGASNQDACVKGSYASGTGNTKCTVCPAGKTNTANGSSSCAATCSNASGVSQWATPSWSTSNTVSNLCTISKCGQGYEYDSSNKICTACPTGQYNETVGGTCKSCSAASGVYTDSGMTTNPTVVTTTTPATSESQCAIDVFLAQFYDATGAFMYSGIDTCNYAGTGSNSSTVGTTCTSVGAYCLNHNSTYANDYTPYTTIPSGISQSGNRNNCWCKMNNKYMWVNSYDLAESCVNTNTGCQAQCENLFVLGNYGTSMGCTAGTDCSSYKSMCLTTAAAETQTVYTSLPSGAKSGGQHCWCRKNNKYVNLYNMGSAETCSSACDFQCDEWLMAAKRFDTEIGCAAASCADITGACKVSDDTWSNNTVMNATIPDIPSGGHCFCGLGSKSFYHMNFGSESECTSNCTARCRNIVTDPDYIEAYNLPSQLNCN